MSEPVGNAPRTAGDDIPGNSHKGREPKKAVVSGATEPEEAKEPVVKIIEGTATTRKVPWYRRWASSLIAEDATSIRDHLAHEVVLPAVKNLIRDLVVGGTDRTLYGSSRARTSGRGIIGDRPGLRTRYDQMSDRGEPRRMLSRDARARHDFDDVVLDSYAEAVEVVEALIDRIERYRAVTVSDLYDLVGVTGSYADRSWGWTDLRTADVRQVRGGFLLDLPAPEPIR